MARLNVATSDIFLARLKQMGASKLSTIQGHLHYIIFKIEPSIKVSYVYNINAKNQYFLQRISPYPLPEGLFSSQEEIVNFIEKDIAKFKNASHSTNFEAFLEINRSFNHFQQNMEHLFLHYNIPKELLEELNTHLTALNGTLQKAKSKSTHIIIKE